MKKTLQQSVFDQIIDHPKKRPLGSRLVGDILTMLSEGDTEARRIVLQLGGGLAIYDPSVAQSRGTAHFLESLDELGIFGARICILHKQVCHGDIAVTAAVLRAYQLGWVSKEVVVSSLETPTKIDSLALLQRVQQMWPRFGRVR